MLQLLPAINSLKGLYRGLYNYVGAEGDTRSVDYSSYNPTIAYYDAVSQTARSLYKPV